MEMVSIDLVILMIANKPFNAGCWAGEIQLASCNSMVRYEVAHSDIPDKMRVIKERDQYIWCLPKYRSNTLNHIATVAECH